MTTEQTAREILDYFIQVLNNYGENTLLFDKKLHNRILEEIEFMIDTS